jgi:hypothetical protein
MLTNSITRFTPPVTATTAQRSGFSFGAPFASDYLQAFDAPSQQTSVATVVKSKAGYNRTDSLAPARANNRLDRVSQTTRTGAQHGVTEAAPTLTGKLAPNQGQRLNLVG